MIRGVRGATTVNQNNESQITSATEKLVREMIRLNNIQATDVVHVLISVTEEITASFPAAALRNIEGWTFVPVMCMREIPVPHSLPFCIRVMMTVHTLIEQEKVQHVYLENATRLRPDLSNKN